MRRKNTTPYDTNALWSRSRQRFIAGRTLAVSFDNSTSHLLLWNAGDTVLQCSNDALQLSVRVACVCRLYTTLDSLPTNHLTAYPFALDEAK